MAAILVSLEVVRRWEEPRGCEQVEGWRRPCVVGTALVLECGEVDSSARSAVSSWVTLSKTQNLGVYFLTWFKQLLRSFGP